MTRKTLIFLFLSFLIMLAACAKRMPSEPASEKESLTPQSESAISSPISEDRTWLGEGGIYRMLDAGFNERTYSAYVDGNDIYSIQWSVTGAESSYTNTVYRGEDKLYQSNNSINCFAVGESAIWVLENNYTDMGMKYLLTKISPDGSILFSEDISHLFAGSFPSRMVIDDEGNLYITTWGKYIAIILDQDGRHRGTININVETDNIIRDGDGKPYLLSDDGSAIYALDTSAGEITLLAEYPGYRISNGGGEFILTIFNETGLYGLREMGTVPEPIVIWMECGILINNLHQVWVLPGGRFLLWNRIGYSLLEPIDISEFKEKKILTMASVMPFSSINQLVDDFNMWSDDYGIKIKSYAPEEARYNRSMPMMNYINDSTFALNMDIATGNQPDLFDLAMLPEDYYSDKGLLADLYNFFDNDPQISSDDFMLLDKLENEGKLPFAARYFYVDTMAGLESRFGNRHAWDLMEYLEIQSQYSGEIIYNITKESFLRRLSGQYITTAVDWQAGSCNFETPEFITILNTAAALRENPEPQNSADLDFTPSGRRLSQGTLIVSALYLSSVSDLAAEEKSAGQSLIFVGWPTWNSNSGSFLHPKSMVGICTGGDQEGAWEFIKYMLTREEDNSQGHNPLSFHKATMADAIAEAMNPSDLNMNPLMQPGDDEKLYRFLEHTVYIGTASERIIDLVMEEAELFLAGAKTAEETAHVIQSRVGILVAE